MVGGCAQTPWLNDDCVRYTSYTERPWRPYGPRPAGALVTGPEERPPPASMGLPCPPPSSAKL